MVLVFVAVLVHVVEPLVVEPLVAVVVAVVVVAVVVVVVVGVVVRPLRFLTIILIMGQVLCRQLQHLREAESK